MNKNVPDALPEASETNIARTQDTILANYLNLSPQEALLFKARTFLFSGVQWIALKTKEERKELEEKFLSDTWREADIRRYDSLTSMITIAGKATSGKIYEYWLKNGALSTAYILSRETLVSKGNVRRTMNYLVKRGLCKLSPLADLIDLEVEENKIPLKFQNTEVYYLDESLPLLKLNVIKYLQNTKFGKNKKYRDTSNVDISLEEDNIIIAHCSVCGYDQTFNKDYDLEQFIKPGIINQEEKRLDHNIPCSNCGSSKSRTLIER